MSAKARAMQTLYARGKVTLDGLRLAVGDGMISAEEYKTITGQVYEG